MLVAGGGGDRDCFKDPILTYEVLRLGGGRSRFFWALLCDLGLVLPLSEP